MILLDTHIWVWWVNGDSRLSSTQQQLLQANESTGLAISIISCWEVAKKVERQKLVLDRPIKEWIDLALGYPGICLLGMTPSIVVESTQLPGNFHHDPADQIIVATARVLDCAVLTADEKILNYTHVKHTG